MGRERGDEDPLLGAFLHELVHHLQAGGLAPAEAERRLQDNEWWGVLRAAGAAVLRAYAPGDVAEEVLVARRCATCGHPLHRTAADLPLPIAGQQRVIRHLPHFAACSCGYAQPLLDAWSMRALLRYLRDHPRDTVIDVADPGFLQALGEAPEGTAPKPPG